jgi:uncharacterized protein
MQYKRLGKTGIEVSRIGFGAMRLPSLPNGNPDPEESVRIIHRAFEMGLNYIDTAVMYCNHKSQEVVGQALKGWRDKVTLSTKNHYRGKDKGAWRKNLEDSLRLLDVDYIDIYNFHGVNWADWEKYVDGPDGILSWMHEARDEGLVRHICASFHDKPENLPRIAETGAFSVITLQYNMLDRSNEPYFEELARRDIGIIAMGPVGGGRLGSSSEHLNQIVDDASSTAEVALRFVLANPYVTLALSGMSTMEQVEENCRVAGRTEPLSEQEHVRVSESLERMKGLAELYCTGCNYCMPCESGVDIPRNFTAVNTLKVWGLADHAQQTYNGMPGKASYCIACGKCEPKCPQNIPIRVQLLEAVRLFDPAFGGVGLRLDVVRKAGDRLTFKARLHNQSETPSKATARFTGGNADPAEFRAEIEEPLRQETTNIAYDASTDENGMLVVPVEIEDPKGARTEERRFTLGFCPTADSMETLRARAGEGPAPLRVDRPDQQVAGEPRYSVAAWTARTDDSLLLRAVITDALPGETPKGHGGVPWNLDVLVDLRDREDGMGPGYHAGMCLLRVPGIAGSGLRTLRGDLAKGEPTVSVETTGNRSTVSMEIPWAALMDPDDLDFRGFDAGDVFGFNLALSVLGEFGQPLSRGVWSTHPGYEHDGASGCLVLAD